MNALSIQEGHVLSWSMGSLVAQELVLKYPEKVDKLILYAAHCDANMFPPSLEVMEKLRDTSGTPEEQGMRWISLMFPRDWLDSHGDRVKEVFFRPMGSTPPQSIGKQAMAIGNWKGCSDRLPQIKSQTLLVAGADDILVPPKNSQYMASRIPKAQLVMLEKGGHGVMFQFPDKFAQTAISFLSAPAPYYVAATVWGGILIALVPAFGLFVYLARGKGSMWLVFAIGAVGWIIAQGRPFSIGWSRLF